jgi:hypothetical protein
MPKERDRGVAHRKVTVTKNSADLLVAVRPTPTPSTPGAHVVVGVPPLGSEYCRGVDPGSRDRQFVPALGDDDERPRERFVTTPSSAHIVDGEKVVTRCSPPITPPGR